MWLQLSDHYETTVLARNRPYVNKIRVSLIYICSTYAAVFTIEIAVLNGLIVTMPIFFKFHTRINRDRTWIWLPFWGVAPCSFVEIDRHFRVAYCINHQGDGLRRQTSSCSLSWEREMSQHCVPLGMQSMLSQWE